MIGRTTDITDVTMLAAIVRIDCLEQALLKLVEKLAEPKEQGMASDGSTIFRSVLSDEDAAQLAELVDSIAVHRR